MRVSVSLVLFVLLLAGCTAYRASPPAGQESPTAVVSPLAGQTSPTEVSSGWTPPVETEPPGLSPASRLDPTAHRNPRVDRDPRALDPFPHSNAMGGDPDPLRPGGGTAGGLPHGGLRRAAAGVTRRIGAGPARATLDAAL